MRRKKSGTGAMRVVLAAMLFVGLFLQIGMLAEISGKNKEIAKVESDIRGMSADKDNLELKIAQTPQELQECFRLLHDAYVGSGFMKPDPSGLRVTLYHALPTTTTLCAKWNGEVVGTISLIRERMTRILQRLVSGLSLNAF